MEGLSVGERSISPADILAQGRRAVDVLRTPLFTNAFYLWVNAAGTALGGFAFWATVAHLYSADDVGLGSAALSTASLIAIFSHLGLGLGLIRFLPESGARGPRLVNAVFVTSAAAAVVLSAMFLAGLPLWAPRLDFLREQPMYSAAFVLFVVAGTLCTVQAHAFVAIRRAKYILVQVGFVQLSRLALAALTASFLGAFAIVASGGIAMSLGAVLGLALLVRTLPGYRPRGVVDPASMMKLFPFSAANYVADSLLLMPGLVLPLIVVGLLSSAEGAYFYVAWFLGFILTLASASLALSLFAEGSHDPRALQVLSRRAVMGGLAVAGVGIVFVLLLGDRLLLAFGREYATEGATLLRLMALAALPAAVVNTYLGALRVTKRTGELMIVAGAIAVTTVALSCALLPLMGLAGAGVGLGLAQGLGLVIILSRLLATSQGTTTERVRRLLTSLAGRSQVEVHQYARGSGDAKAT